MRQIEHRLQDCRFNYRKTNITVLTFKAHANGKNAKQHMDLDALQKE